MFRLLAILVVGSLAAAFVWGGLILWATAVSLLILFGLVAYNQYGFVRIPEMEVGVLFNKHQQSFARFVPSGRHPVNPLTEQFSHTIPTGSGSANGRCLAAQTSGGIALNVTWTVSYTLNPFRIAADKQAKLARSLPTKAASVVTKHMGNCLQHVLGDYTVEQLVRSGSHKRLERELRQCLAERLADSGFEVSRVMIGAIDLPAPVRKALEAAEERRLQTENEVQALSRLQQVISRFSDAEVQRLLELERIHALGQHGVALYYPGMVEEKTAVFPLPTLS